jgi:hypothetical protein
MDDEARQRLQRHIYPRPPEDVIDEAILRSLRKPEEQDWHRGDDLHADKPMPFSCGFHNDTRYDRPLEMVDLDGLDGKTYRVGQCPRCGRMFWGVKGRSWRSS